LGVTLDAAAVVFARSEGIDVSGIAAEVQGDL
jgi:hypothetical protein